MTYNNSDGPIYSMLTTKADCNSSNIYKYFYHGPSSCPCGGGSSWEFVANYCSPGYGVPAGTPTITPTNNTMYCFACEPI